MNVKRRLLAIYTCKHEPWDIKDADEMVPPGLAPRSTAPSQPLGECSP